MQELTHPLTAQFYLLGTRWKCLDPSRHHETMCSSNISKRNKVVSSVTDGHACWLEVRPSSASKSWWWEGQGKEWEDQGVLGGGLFQGKKVSEIQKTGGRVGTSTSRAAIFISRLTDTTLKLQGMPSDFFIIGKPHHSAGGGFLSPMVLLIKDPAQSAAYTCGPFVLHQHDTAVLLKIAVLVGAMEEWEAPLEIHKIKLSPVFSHPLSHTLYFWSISIYILICNTSNNIYYVAEASTLPMRKFCLQRLCNMNQKTMQKMDERITHICHLD